MVRNNLRDIRKRRGVALWGLAVLAHTSASMLSAIERWGHKPQPSVCDRIAEALGVGVQEIWPEDQAIENRGGVGPKGAGSHD